MSSIDAGQPRLAAGSPPTTLATRHSRPVRKGLLDWLESPRAGGGLRFANDDGSWSLLEYPQLASLVFEAAAQIEQQRSCDSGPVSIIVPSGPEFVAAFLGALVAGNTPSPLALPLVMRDPDHYMRHMAAILEASDPALVLASPELHEVLARAGSLAGIASPLAALELTGADAPTTKRPPAELALLQFTSGSSGTPRGVRVTWENLERNIAQIGRWLQFKPDDSCVTWLPLYHDMGLIGCLLVPLASQNDVWILRPDQFVREPLRWLECFGKRGASHGVAPTFGFAYAHRRISEEQLEGMDFSSWQVAIVAAERLDCEVLNRFARRLRPRGFDVKAYRPAYGLAEATLAVTGVPVGEIALAVKPSWSQVRFGERLVIEDSARLGEDERFGSSAGWLVTCGRPDPEVSISIVDEEGRDLPDSFLGEIKLQGPTIAAGYHAGERRGSSRFVSDGLHTGDAGFLLDGELFVLGRLGDSMKVRGRTVFVEDVEARIETTEGVPRGRCVVFAGSDGERDVLAAVVEATRGAWVHEVARILDAEVGQDASIQVLASPPQTIQRTSSGKPRRRMMWQEMLAGRLSGDVVYAKDRSPANGSDAADAAHERSAGLLDRGMSDPGVEAFRERVRSEIERHVMPEVAAAEERRAFPRVVLERLAATGLFRERWIGGDHGDAGKGVLLAEELGRALTGGIGVGVSVHLEAVLSILLRYGDSEALRRHAELALDGRIVGCFAASERTHGSDLASLQAVATRGRDGWRIEGEKRYVSLGAAADFALVLAREYNARTSTTSAALTLFAVPAEGLRVVERLRGMGMRSLETVTLQIDACVPDELVIGRPGRGLHIATWGLTHERLASAAQALGAASAAIELATTHARRRVQFGARLIDQQAIRMHLGDLASRVWLARAGVYALSGSLKDARPEAIRQVAGAKVTAARLAERVVSDAMQVLGARGYLEDTSPLARMLRDVRLARIGGGTDEMMWELVAGGLRGDDTLYDRFVAEP